MSECGGPSASDCRNAIISLLNSYGVSSVDVYVKVTSISGTSASAGVEPTNKEKCDSILKDLSAGQTQIYICPIS